MTTTDVLIVGAGPTGLTMATLLIRMGVRIRIVEKTPGPTEQTRAIVVHAKTLELFAKLHLADKAVEQGQRIDAFRLMNEDKQAGLISFRGESERTPYPFPLIYTQDRTEHLLIDSLAEAGGLVEWNTELLSLEQGLSGTRATLRHTDGREEIVEAGWIVGADGAHSFIRSALSLGFAGESYKQALFLADIDLQGNLKEKEVVGGFTRLGFFTFFPMPGARRFRVVGSLPLQYSNQETLTVDEVQQILNTYKLQVTITQARWISVYRTHHRMSERFRVGRVFLVGDAAHIHSPAGGQGMNTGIGDAYNLAWKLGLVVTGKARMELLDSYEAERMPFARAILNGSDKLFHVQGMSQPVVQWFKMFGLPPLLSVVTSIPPLRRRIFWLLSQLWTSYRHSPAVATSEPHTKGPQAGDRAPYGIFEVGPDKGKSLFSKLEGVDHHLLLFAGRRVGFTGLDLQTMQERLQSLLSRYRVPVHVHTIAARNLHLHRQYGAEEPSVFLIRPDGHIAYRGRGEDVVSFASYLDGLFTRAEGSAFEEAIDVGERGPRMDAMVDLEKGVGSMVMSWRHWVFDLLYRVGMPIWDISTPPEVRALVEGPGALPAGRALDMGCGTGTHTIYLAQHGWDAIGVDFSASAIGRARKKANGIAGATFLQADVTRLREQGLSGPFDLVLDMGCFHALPQESRQAYVQEVATVTIPGAHLLMWEVSEKMGRFPVGWVMQPDEIENRFSRQFIIERVEPRDFVVERLKGRLKVKGNWYWLRRKE